MLKKIAAAIFLLISFLVFTVCAGNIGDIGSSRTQEQKLGAITGAQQGGQPEPQKQRKVLVVYFSHSGNTREMAQQIHEQVGGDIMELQTVAPYPNNYLSLVIQAREERQAGFKPPLITKITDISSYDVIFLGFPIWGETIPAPITTFLAEYDLSGKTIAPFCTHGGWGAGQSVAAITERSPRSVVLNVLAVESKNVKTSQNEIAQWSQKVK